MSEYRVDRLHQRLLQASSHEDCRAEAFPPADFGVFDGSSVGVGGEFQDALVGEGDLGSAVVPKLREDDSEDAGEIAGLGRSQAIGSQLLRKFEVKEDAEELHAFFMQKECDRHLVRLFSGGNSFTSMWSPAVWVALCGRFIGSWVGCSMNRLCYGDVSLAARRSSRCCALT